MIRIRYSDREVEICGTASELVSISETLKQLAQGNGMRAILCDPKFDPAPYQNRLSALTLVKNDGKDRVAIDGDHLVISGASDGLSRISSFFDMPLDARPGYHHHHEHFEDNHCIDPRSLPLVVSVQESVMKE